MLNKLSYNLVNALNEAEDVEVKRIAYTAETYLKENCSACKELQEDIESEEEKESIEERLASLRTQLEIDGDQLADDEREAIKAEIAELENQLDANEVDDKIMNESTPEVEAARKDSIEKGLLSEKYSERLGGNPEDFVNDCTTIKRALLEIDTEALSTKLAQEMIMNFIDTVDNQASMTVNRYNLSESEYLSEGNLFADSSNSLDELLDRAMNELEGDDLFELLQGMINRIKEVADTCGLMLESDNQDKTVEPGPRKLTREEWDKEFDSLFSRLLACANPDVTNAGREPQDRVETIDESEKTLIAEAEVTGLKEVKSQGNVHMLQDETNKYIVGENYNAEEGLIENAEIYDNKEEADKDYLGRCEITGGRIRRNCKK